MNPGWLAWVADDMKKPLLKYLYANVAKNRRQIFAVIPGTIGKAFRNMLPQCVENLRLMSTLERCRTAQRFRTRARALSISQ